MKIAVSGKGGVGKTPIAAGLAKAFAEKNKVIAVDADASLNLSTTLGVKNPKPLATLKDIADKRARIPGGLIRMNPKVDDLVDEYATQVSEHLRLLTMGTSSAAGAGCLCPENAIVRSLLSNLVLRRREFVVIDLEAGLEPMTRGTVKGIDAVLVVCEPSVNSISVAKRLLLLAGELGVKECLVVGNKVHGREDLEYLSRSFSVFHAIPYDVEYSEKSRDGAYPGETIFHKSVSELAERIQEKKR